jgi:peptide subunit release factor 1 (eRF1)
MKQEDVYAMSSRPARQRKCVLSVYLNVDQSQNDNLNRGFETQLKGMSSSLRKSLDEDPERDGLAAAIHRAADFVSTYAPKGRGLAIFIDESDGFFSHEELYFPVTNQIRWGRELFLQPLANALDELEDYGIVLVDRTKFRLFLVQQGKFEEVANGEGSGRRTRHVKSTGPDHAESSANNQRRADNQIRTNLREVVEKLNEFVKTKQVHRLVLAGTPEILAELRSLLPTHLGSHVIGVTPLAMEASPANVLAAAQPVAKAYEGTTEVAKVNGVVTEAAKKQKAVVGLRDTLHAINSGRVWELIYSAASEAPGFECRECSALFLLETAPCTFCSASVQPVSNIIERAVERALRHKAKVEMVTGKAAAALDTAGGIGAFLKTRTKAVRAG